jgi:hypothetical protein
MFYFILIFHFDMSFTNFFFSTINRTNFDKQLTLADIIKFTKDDKMKYLVVEYINGNFYGFNLVDANERRDAKIIVADVDNDFTICGWRISKDKPSWAASYAKWQGYIKNSPHVDQDVCIKAVATGNNDSASSADHSVESEEESRSDDDSDASDLNCKKKAKTNNICDWGHVIQCNHTELPPFKCQKDGCKNLVHHLCQGNWERSNGHSDILARYCFSHHPKNSSSDDLVDWENTTDHLQSNTVNSGSMKTVQNCGVDASTGELNLKSVNTLPILEVQPMHGMNSHETGINAGIKAQSVAMKQVVDHVFSGEDLDLFSNSNLKEEVSNNVNRNMSSSVDFYITGPFNNEKTGKSVWSIVLGVPGKSWALKDTFIQSYLHTLLLKRQQNRPSDIDISFCQSFYKINIRNNEFGKESIWRRKPPVRGKPGQVVKRMSFVYGCPTSSNQKGLNALFEAIKFLCFTMTAREINPVGNLLIDHLKDYHLGLFNHLTKGCDENAAAKKLTSDIDSHFKGGPSNHLHEKLNRFMVDYDIIRILKNYVGYSSWDDVPYNQKELCFKNYNAKMPLPNWNCDEERYSL